MKQCEKKVACVSELDPEMALAMPILPEYPDVHGGQSSSVVIANDQT